MSEWAAVSALDDAARRVSDLCTQIYCAKAAAHWALTRDHREALIRLYREIRQAELEMPAAVQAYREAQASERRAR